MVATRIPTFDTYQALYGGATVEVRKAGLHSLAAIYADENKAEAVDNPVILAEYESDGVSYGKWPFPIYVDEPYELWVQSTDVSGVVRPPITRLDGVSATLATVTPTGASETASLGDYLSRVVYAQDYGEINNTDTAANTLSIQAAIGVAAGNGGGRVVIPPGTIPFSSLTVPGDVTLVGYGRGVTVLQSQTDGEAITISGDHAGFVDLTIDGVNQISSSIGVYAVGKNDVFMSRVTIMRFDTGVRARGGRRWNMGDVNIGNNTYGAILHGDENADAGADGDVFQDLLWSGGVVSDNISYGIDLSYAGLPCQRNTFLGLTFDSNTGPALKLIGTRMTRVEGSSWTNNTSSVSIDDEDDETVFDNRTSGIHFVSCHFNDDDEDDQKEITVTGEASDVVFEDCRFSYANFTMTVPVLHPVLLIDCVESNCTITGDGTKIIRRRRALDGSSTGLTSDATVTKAWSLQLEPGQMVILQACVLAKGRNVNSRAEYIFACSAHRPPSYLYFDTQTADFTVGQKVTGATSGASARIVAQTDSGTTGNLLVTDIVGAFIDNEIITDDATGSATVNGVLVAQNAAILGTATALLTREDVGGWAAAFAANGPEIELQVTGAASTTIEWTSHVDVRST